MGASWSLPSLLACAPAYTPCPLPFSCGFTSGCQWAEGTGKVWGGSAGSPAILGASVPGLWLVEAPPRATSPPHQTPTFGPAPPTLGWLGAGERAQLGWEGLHPLPAPDGLGSPSRHSARGALGESWAGLGWATAWGEGSRAG